jgi:WD40 repeat protein
VLTDLLTTTLDEHGREGNEEPSGKLDGTRRVWNPAAGRRVSAPLQTGSGPAGGPLAVVAFSPGGKLLATSSLDGTVRLWNPATGRPVSTVQVWPK